MISIRILDADADEAAAEFAFSHLISDPVIAAREAAAPGEQKVRDFTGAGHPTHRLFRVGVLDQIIAEMSDGERSDLRDRLLARRVRQLPKVNAPCAVKI
jgi:hypothetical protein